MTDTVFTKNGILSLFLNEKPKVKEAFFDIRERNDSTKLHQLSLEDMNDFMEFSILLKSESESECCFDFAHYLSKTKRFAVSNSYFIMSIELNQNNIYEHIAHECIGDNYLALNDATQAILAYEIAVLEINKSDDLIKDNYWGLKELHKKLFNLYKSTNDPDKYLVKFIEHKKLFEKYDALSKNEMDNLGSGDIENDEDLPF